MDKKEIANRLIEARKASNLNQSEVARALGVTPQAVQKWEIAETSPRASQYEKLEKVLGRSRQWLMFGEGTVSPNDSLFDEYQELRERVDQAISCLRASELAEGRERDNLTSAAKRILEKS